MIDAKSGVSGAGRDAKQGSLFCEVGENFAAYGVATRRHAPEIDQCLGDFAGRAVTVTFTPHLVPMSRGIFATIYVSLAPGLTPRDLHERLASAYAEEPFVRVLPMATLPATQHVRGTICARSRPSDRRPGRAILLSVTDNLVKGASGQAVQNINVMTGLDERLGSKVWHCFRERHVCGCRGGSLAPRWADRTYAVPAFFDALRNRRR